MIRQFALFLPVAALTALAGCQQAKPVYVDSGAVRLSANPDNPAVGYFVVHGGSAPVTLRAIETDAAVRLEMHESKTEGGVASMAPLESVDVPAGGKVAFAPGGKHVMLWKINPQAIAAGRMTFTYIFSNGDRILADSIISAPDGKVTGSGPAPTAE